MADSPGKALRKARIDREWNQLQAAEALKMGQRRYADLENGKGPPVDAVEIETIREVLGVDREVWFPGAS